AEIVPEVHEDHLGVGPADARHARLGHRPIVTDRGGSLELLHAHRRAGEPDHEVVRLVRGRPFLGLDPVEQTLHVSSYPPRPPKEARCVSTTPLVLLLFTAEMTMIRTSSATQANPRMMPAVASPWPPCVPFDWRIWARATKPKTMARMSGTKKRNPQMPQTSDATASPFVRRPAGAAPGA